MSGTNKLVQSEMQKKGASEQELATALMNADAEAAKATYGSTMKKATESVMKK